MVHDDCITDEERRHLISGLHRLLAWVGEPLPETVDIDGKTLEIHETVWQCIHDKDVTDEEKSNLEDMARLLEKKEKGCEETLQTASLTHKEADILYHEIASIMRAITDLRECETGKVNLKEPNEDIIKRIEDANRWMTFLKTVGKR